MVTKNAPEKKETQGGQSFELIMPVAEFFRNVNAGNVLKGALRGAEVIIAGSELYRLCKADPEGVAKASVSLLPQKELFDLLRSARDNSGRDVYRNAKFEMGKVDVTATYGVQTFINVKALDSLSRRNEFMRQFGIDMVNSGNAYVIRYDGDRKYAAILVPPIVIHYKKELYAVPMGNLEAMVAKGDAITIKGVNGDAAVDLGSVLAIAREEIAKPGATVAVIKDGSHRAFISYTANVPLTAIIIRDSDEAPTSAPINFFNMIMTNERPDRADHRYPGVYQGGRVDLRKIGIDP